MTETIQTLIDRFLADRRESDGGWATVEQDDLELLYHVLDLLIEAKFDKDPDGDLPIEYKIIDRTKCERLHYWPVPYLRFGGLGDVEKIRHHEAVLLMNLDTALEALQGLRASMKIWGTAG